MNARTIMMVAALALAPSMASAADVIIRDRAPDVTVAPPGPDVTIERRAPAPSMRDEEETTGEGQADDNCRRTTVQKEDDSGRTTTIHKKECD
jgi:hypothetical protein